MANDNTPTFSEAAIVSVDDEERPDSALRQTVESGVTADELHQIFSVAIEKAPIPLIIFAEDGKVLARSAAIWAAAGYDPRRVSTIGDWFEYGFGKDASKAEASMRWLFEHDQPNPGKDLEVRTASGELQIWHGVALAPERLRDGRKYMVGYAMDVTKERKLESALRAAKEQAERESRRKSRILRVVSHDLRQPLQAIDLLRASLSMQARDGQSTDTLRHLKGAIDHMRDLLDIFLDFGQLDSGILVPRIQPLSIDKILTRVAKENQAAADQKGLTIRVMRTAAIIRSDRRLLERIVQSLVGNAIKFTDTGRILIGCRRHGAGVTVQVWDTGIGIDSTELESIFEEFYQVHGRARGHARGYGLGLAIVRVLANILDHPVHVRSVPGKGSVFSVTIPLARPTDASAKRKGQPAPQILVVDDDPVVRIALSDFFKRIGYSVATAASGPEACALARQSAGGPALVITDYNLSDGTSCSNLIPQLRQGNPNQKALILTGDPTVGDLVRIQRDDVPVLHKPITPLDLGTHVRRMLEPNNPSIVSPGTVTLLGARNGPSRKRTGTVLLVEDDPAIAASFSTFLRQAGYDVLAYEDGESLLAALPTVQDGCIVTEVGLPGMSGLELQQELSERGVTFPLIFLTSRPCVEAAVKAIEGGAVDYLERPVRPEHLFASISRAFESQRDSKRDESRQQTAQTLIEHLTRREREVLELVATGYSNKATAHKLGISARTVENHRARVMQKLGVRSIAELLSLWHIRTTGGSPLPPVSLPDSE